MAQAGDQGDQGDQLPIVRGSWPSCGPWKTKLWKGTALKLNKTSTNMTNIKLEQVSSHILFGQTRGFRTPCPFPKTLGHIWESSSSLFAWVSIKAADAELTWGYFSYSHGYLIISKGCGCLLKKEMAEGKNSGPGPNKPCFKASGSNHDIPEQRRLVWQPASCNAWVMLPCSLVFCR
jgi:hypothetical protein